MRKAVLAVAMAWAAVAGGCHHHGAPAVHGARPVSHGAVVVVPAGHVHDTRCGHYQYRGNWHHSAGHVHGDGCGHVYRGGHWLYED